jgi:4-amino-4-deoxyprephenate dehydrogenase
MEAREGHSIWGKNMSRNISNTLIIGANGNVGTLFVNKLSEYGISVTGIDVIPESFYTGNCYKYISLDITDKNKVKGEISEAIKSADCIIACLPEEAAILSMPILLEEMLPGTLFIDTLSVKSNFLRVFAENISRLDKSIEMISLNPMFSPTLGFKANNLALIKVREGLLSDRFISLLENWGANIIFLTAEEHDLNASAIQVATHAAIISFGLALQKMGYDINKAKHMSTPPHNILLSLLSRILTSKVEVYWDIQASNPYANMARGAILESITELSELIESKNYVQFESLLQRVAEVIEPNLYRLAENCDLLIENQIANASKSK